MQTKNNVRIIGYLVENNMEIVTNTDQTQTCRGTITLMCNGNNRVRASFYTNQMKKDKTPNKQFNDMMTFLTKVVARDETKGEKGSIVEISGGNLVNRSYYDTKTRMIQTIDDIRGSFVRILPSCKEEDMKATFNFTGRIKNIIDEVKDDKPTGRVILKLIGINYRGDANNIEFVVDSNYASALKTLYSIGQTVNLDGDIINQMEVTTQQAIPAAFGVITPTNSTNFVREYRAHGGSAPFSEMEPEYISDELMTEAETKAAELIEESKNKAMQNATQNTATNFANAVNNSFGFAGMNNNLPPMSDIANNMGLRF